MKTSFTRMCRVAQIRNVLKKFNNLLPYTPVRFDLTNVETFPLGHAARAKLEMFLVLGTRIKDSLTFV
jgi:hypothetical protein